MRVIMFDRQSIFIHGTANRLSTLVPEINITGTNQIDALWSLIAESPAGICMLDGNINQSQCLWLLEAIARRYPDLRVIVVLTENHPGWTGQLMQCNVMAIIPRTATPEIFASVLTSVSMGMVCFPGEWVNAMGQHRTGLASLSGRQREVLQRLAAGESNKEIGRALNISAGTVKAHLETLFRRLEVKNRTQAAMLYTRTE